MTTTNKRPIPIKRMFHDAESAILVKGCVEDWLAQASAGNARSTIRALRVAALAAVRIAGRLACHAGLPAEVALRAFTHAVHAEATAPRIGQDADFGVSEVGDIP